MSFLENLSICQGCKLSQSHCAGPCGCTLDGYDIREHAEAGVCGDGRYGENRLLLPIIYPLPTARGGESKLTREETFHELWAEIHDPGRHWTAGWWATVEARLPCGDCKTETKVYKAANPIPFDDDGACFLWGVEFHNVVNVRLGKPEVKHPGTKPGRS